MTSFGLVLAVFLFTNLLVALLWVSRGPTIADRLLVALLFATTGVALLLLLAYTESVPALVDTALVFALLATITGAAFTQRVWQQGEEEDERSC
jgi:multicomponent Na+:H+ antiporter subunit F